MATFIRKARNNDNTQVNFNQSKEIDYWAKKYNVSKEEFQKLFAYYNFSISKLLASGALANKQAA